MNPTCTLSLLRLLLTPRYHRYDKKHMLWSRAEQGRLDFYSAFIRPGDLVFDVGANMGNRSRIFLRIGANVVAFEPQPYYQEFLASAFRGAHGFTLAREALDEREGRTTMHVSRVHTLSTLNRDWLEKVQEGGRFSGLRWDRQISVETITLDQAIDCYGIPAFIKIDVEGHELAVIRGLSRAVPMISLEFASESLDNILSCIDHLEGIAARRYRISFGESMQFSGHDWMDAATLRTTLQDAMAEDPLTWGDIYAQLVPGQG